ncbi:MAG: hypothetical protein ACLFQV_08640, partial [Vulcanimicrobiota bacterium]
QQAGIAACKANLRSLMTAITMYSADHPGVGWNESHGGSDFAPGDSPLYPDYIGSLPTCPATGRSDTYIVDYRLSTGGDSRLWIVAACQHYGAHGDVISPSGDVTNNCFSIFCDNYKYNPDSDGEWCYN